MANNTITIASTENTSNEVLQLNSPHLGSFDERFQNWGHQSEPSREELEMNMEMGMGMGMEMGMGDIGNGFSQEMTFEGDMGILDSMNAIPFTPGYELDTFSSTFEDPFPYQSISNDFSMMQTPIPEAGPATTEPMSEPKEGSPDKKLLSFGPPTSNVSIFTSAGPQTWPIMTAEVYGMFFVAEDVYRDSIPTPGRLTELTCYRRNLFQISGNITMNRDITHLVDETGTQVPVSGFRAILSAAESNEGKVTDIISVPWKSSQPTPGAPSEDTAPAKLPLDLTANPELDPAVVSIPIAWKRLQFKHATANNGRRKGLQQHYVIKIDVEGKAAEGKFVKLAEIQSGPIIVRGRSPRNFDSRKDVNLSAAERRTDGKPRQLEPRQEPSSRVDPGVINGSYQFYALNTLQQPREVANNDWNTPSAAPLPSPRITDAHRVKRPSISYTTPSLATATSTISRPPVPKTTWNSDPHRPPVKPSYSQQFIPIDLSISDADDRRTSTSVKTLNLGETSPKIEKAEVSTTTKRVLVGSPIESADLLYEYFPLSLDDWMPPVDAIYRPHVVHHTIIPPDLKAEQVRNRPKRYFSADD